MPVVTDVTAFPRVPEGWRPGQMSSCLRDDVWTVRSRAVDRTSEGLRSPPGAGPGFPTRRKARGWEGGCPGPPSAASGSRPRFSLRWPRPSPPSLLAVPTCRPQPGPRLLPSCPQGLFLGVPRPPRKTAAGPLPQARWTYEMPTAGNIRDICHVSPNPVTCESPAAQCLSDRPGSPALTNDSMAPGPRGPEIHSTGRRPGGPHPNGLCLKLAPLSNSMKNCISISLSPRYYTVMG